MNQQRVASFVKKTEADSWVVSAGPPNVLEWFAEWFAETKIPVFALYGGRIGLPIAGTGPYHEPALRAAVRRLVQLGHHQIVSLSNRGLNGDGPRYTKRLIFDAMEAHDIVWNSYNYPCWNNDQDGFRRCLESLFSHTPPSALIIEEATYFFATLQFCTDRKLRIPQDVSLICSEHAASFDFANPPLAHIAWDYRPMVRRMVRWADNIARGREDKRQNHIKARFIEGGTIGPAVRH